AREEAAKKPAARKDSEPRRRSGKLTIAEALGDGEERVRSLASVRRARERQKAARQGPIETTKIVREVVVPETITVQELANRMAERAPAVIKTLMGMDVMATINQNIDADTAELVIAEFGHTVKRVSESDVEDGLRGEDDAPDSRLPRPPVVTVMGHVDHGKTSLLDAMRSTDVADHEAGGITQHIGAYQVNMAGGQKITFIDTPGHAAFTEMRSRGAQVTDIVVLCVAADDGVMPQTIEAIRHAQAAEVPIIVAINKMDVAGADANRVKQELLQHEVVVEDMGGETLTVEVSAKERTNLDKLEETILLQAELLDLTANPDRAAEGVVVESRMEQGRGAVATVLVQRGTLNIGDLLVAGGEWGRVKAMTDERNSKIDSAGPGVPVEVLGLNGVPLAGDEVSAVESESRAREITEYRQRRIKDTQAAKIARGTLEQMFEKIKEGDKETLSVVIKADVHGSVEALIGSIEQMNNDEVSINVLHSAIGGINESDITLANASDALIIGFNVRANPQAREHARRDGVEIRYYSIIYNAIDDLKQALSGMLSPEIRETFIGYAEIKEVFSVSKVGKVAGCMVTEGLVKRGAKVRLLRDDVVIHEGDLSQLKRFKDDAKEVREGTECGMAFANYDDLKAGDIIECFEVEEIAREL
ncbi:MAG: translation initiation factor IF-2, partial [Rhodospirillales bacterium]|nr:translation initiation factor IF-2 [Rhodospirillales bacterium]